MHVNLKVFRNQNSQMNFPLLLEIENVKDREFLDCLDYNVSVFFARNFRLLDTYLIRLLLYINHYQVYAINTTK